VREVEVKYRIADVGAVEAALLRHGIRLGPATVQDDQAYAPEGWSYGDDKLGVSFVRLRTVGDTHIFTLKRPAENALSCAEHETAVEDRDAMDAAIAMMGFSPTVRIIKTRRAAHLDDLSVCLDDVVGLGAFLELERLVRDDCRGEEVQRELAQFVASLDIDAERVVETYDSLVRAAQSALV
jgi:adenylate cyclase class 2